MPSRKDPGLKDKNVPERSGDAARTLDRETFGKRLRSARKGLGWTLAHLSALSGVSITTISRAERGQLALGYENFAALGKALQMDMGAMFVGAGETSAPFQGPIVTRANQGVAYTGQSITYEFLGTEAAGKQMIPTVATVHARRISGPEAFASHPGEEFVYVLSGEIEVHFTNGEFVRLARGDSLYFDSRLGHTYISVSRQLARTVGVTTSASQEMRSAQALTAKAAAGKRKGPARAEPAAGAGQGGRPRPARTRKPQA